MTPRTERRRAEREVQKLADRLQSHIDRGRYIPHSLMQKLKEARLRALLLGPVRRPASRPSISEASAR